MDIHSTLFHAYPDALIVVDRNGIIVLANTQAAGMFGFRVDEMIGLGVETLVPDSGRRSHAAMRARYMARPTVRPMGVGRDLEARRRDGTTFPVEISLSPISTVDGEHYLAAIRNVVESSRARKELTRQRYDAFVARIGQMILEREHEDLTMERLCKALAGTMDMDAAAIVYLDPHREELHVKGAIALDDLLAEGVPWSTSTDNSLGRVLATGVPVIIEDFIAARNPAPSPRLIDAGFRSSAIVPIFDLGRAVGAMVVLSRHTRGFNRDDLHMLQSVANLVASEDQKQRSEGQLLHLHRMEALGQLTGGIAHDFNNLLTVISGNLQLLEMELDGNDRTSGVIEGAKRAVSRGADLISKLLTFARKQRFTPRHVDLVQLLAELSRILDRVLGERWRLELTVAADTPPVLGDPAQLESCLLNLVLNARDAMPEGGQVRITVEPRNIADDAFLGEIKAGHYVAVTVTDQGEGIPDAVLGRIFEPFFTTKKQGRGSGLGLSMVHGYVKQSGGHIAVSSRPGAGARFELYLPVAKLAAQDAARPEDNPMELHRCKVLVVEDEEEVREIAVAFIRSLGCDVLTATDASEALCVLCDNPDIDLLFSDIVLGSGMSGGELAEQARQLRPDLAVVLTTGYEGDVPTVGMAFPVLRKPYRREDLFEALYRARGAVQPLIS
jgi:PAS domain S-box-containing protein